MPRHNHVWHQLCLHAVRAPSQVTSQPCERRMSATASAGKMCPAGTTCHDQDRRSCRNPRASSSFWRRPPLANSAQVSLAPNRRLVNICAHAANPREAFCFPSRCGAGWRRRCNSPPRRCRQNSGTAGSAPWSAAPHVHSDVDRRLHAEPHAPRQRGKIALEKRGMAARSGSGNTNNAKRNHCDQRTATQFFGDHRHQKIGMRLGQIKQFFHACAQATPNIRRARTRSALAQLIPLP